MGCACGQKHHHQCQGWWSHQYTRVWKKNYLSYINASIKMLRWYSCKTFLSYPLNVLFTWQNIFQDLLVFIHKFYLLSNGLSSVGWDVTKVLLYSSYLKLDADVLGFAKTSFIIPESHLINKILIACVRINIEIYKNSIIISTHVSYLNALIVVAFPCMSVPSWNSPISAVWKSG